MKRPGDPCKLTVVYGDVPQPGTELRMASGRRYLVLRIGGTKTLHCIVLAADDEPGEPVWEWFWVPRKKKRRVLR